MKTKLMDLLEERFGRNRTKKHRVTLECLEKEMIRTAYTYRSDYERDNGFIALASAIVELVADGYLIPIKSSEKSFKPPFIHTAFWLKESFTSIAGWNKSAMLMKQDLLDLRHYDIHPEAQTEENWARIERVYTFLRTSADREFVTREERSLELFEQEKWLTESVGERFLRSLGLTLYDLKAVVAREPFVYYVQPTQMIESVLIVENKSFFHSAKRLMRSDQAICGITPDMLIYGEGWKIDSSLLFLEELKIDPLAVDLYYVGDMDRAGWDIYGKLKTSYPHLKLQLAISIYLQMVKQSKTTYNYDSKQSCKDKHLKLVMQEFAEYQELKVFVERLLEDNLRIPQEVLNYEVMARLADR